MAKCLWLTLLAIMALSSCSQGAGGGKKTNLRKTILRQVCGKSQSPVKGAKVALWHDDVEGIVISSRDLPTVSIDANCGTEQRIVTQCAYKGKTADPNKGDGKMGPFKFIKDTGGVKRNCNIQCFGSTYPHLECT